MRKLFVPLVTISIFIFGFTHCTSNNNPPPAAPSETPEKTTEPSADMGPKLFEEKCVICHGSDGTAGINNAASLQASKLDLNAIIQVVTNGRNTMPPFKSQLSGSEIEAVAQYAYSLQNKE